MFIYQSVKKWYCSMRIICLNIFWSYAVDQITEPKGWYHSVPTPNKKRFFVILADICFFYWGTKWRGVPSSNAPWPSYGILPMTPTILVLPIVEGV